MAKTTLLVRHEVEDFAAWHSVYESVDGLREEHGCTDAEVLLDPANDHDVYVLHRFPSLEQAQAYADSSELREAMGRAGVKGAPRIEIAVEA
jgi:quinol monooxygenase YgiN